MSATYYHLLGRVVLAVHAGHGQLDVREALSKAGLTKDVVERGRKLAEEGEALITRRLEEQGEDRTVEHGLHAAVDELEMWAQTARFRLKAAVTDTALLEQVFDKHLHAHEHTLTAIARALRILSMIRASKEIQEALGDVRATHDLLVRGWTLLKKVLKYTDMRLGPAPASDKDGAVFKDLARHSLSMESWLEGVATSAKKLSDKPILLGLVGYIPEGVGLPLGGGSFAVVLHEQARRTPPDPTDARATSGWSIGRQGRNRENLGKGFVEPTFE
ncbi:MAG: hypothetical protein H0U74_19000 [Bradymonadaceae bacterium]|nr:hypothetical protein [Lujinxingiaceae bacterium]